MRAVAWLAVLLLCGCVTQQQVTVQRNVPDDLTGCHPAHPLPKAPPPPRSAQQLIDWSRALQETAITNSANLIDCAQRMIRLNAWINAGEGRRL
jgi:hypothetical protein